MLASSLEEEYSDDVSCESVGNSGYLQRHNAQMFEEGRSFSGNERDKLYFNRGDNTFADLSDLSQHVVSNLSNMSSNRLSKRRVDFRTAFRRSATSNTFAR